MLMKLTLARLLRTILVSETFKCSEFVENYGTIRKISFIIFPSGFGNILDRCTII